MILFLFWTLAKKVKYYTSIDFVIVYDPLNSHRYRLAQEID